MVYAFQAALYVAASGNDKGYVPIRRIATDLKLSFHFLTKILQILTQHQIMTSYRGPNGGVALARPPAEITLMDMITAIEGTDFFEGCILNLPGCGEDTPCPLHKFWGEARDKIKLSFESTTLEELGRKINQDGLRLRAG